MPSDLTVSNSSCLISLEAIGHLSLLESLYGQILIPDSAREWGMTPPNWISPQRIQNLPLAQSLLQDLGAGEAEALTLAVDVKAVRLILDDKKARRLASSFGVPLIGTAGIVLQAKQRGFISEIRSVLESLQQVGFHISDGLFQQALNLASE
jgi:uncharacterized protein